MPATEKTWRDQKLMHVVFGCTGLLMLVATVWMFATDHSREWKDYQRTMRSVDVRMTEWRMADEKARDNQAEKSVLEAQVLAAEADAPPQALFDAFLTGVEDDGQKDNLDALYGVAADTQLAPNIRREHREKLMSAMGDVVKRAEFNENDLLSRRKFQSADYDERRAQYDLAVRDGLQDRMKELDREVIAEREARDQLTLEYEAAKARRVQLQSSFDAMNQAIADLKAEIAEKDADFNRLASTFDERQATYFTSSVPFLGKKWLELPVLDAFNSPLKIDNLWTENLTITNGSFGSVRRFDRCTTCHKSIDKTAPGSAVDPLYPHQFEVVLELILPDSQPTRLRLEGDGGQNGDGPLAPHFTYRTVEVIVGAELEFSSETSDDKVKGLKARIDELAKDDDELAKDDEVALSGLTFEKIKSEEEDANKWQVRMSQPSDMEKVSGILEKLKNDDVGLSSVGQLQVVEVHAALVFDEEIKAQSVRGLVDSLAEELGVGEVFVEVTLEFNSEASDDATSELKGRIEELAKEAEITLTDLTLEKIGSGKKDVSEWLVRMAQPADMGKVSDILKKLQEEDDGLESVGPLQTVNVFGLELAHANEGEEVEEAARDWRVKMSCNVQQANQILALFQQRTDDLIVSTYGIALASEGLINANDVTIRRVDPESLAAFARLISGEGETQNGLMVGDVVTHVNNDKVLSTSDLERFLLENAKWGQTAQIRVQRGLPHPYSSHPRLDLFVGSLSPHKLSVFGCSICHEGQGSATEFKWVSHSPNSPEQQKQWSREYGWFNNHHWIYPMYPDRFSESSCLKCHHEVVELALTDRFEEPPAPKLMKGYNLILDYGCYGCHEINGYNGPDKRIGPDMRLEPNYFAAAAQVKSDPKFEDLNKEQKSWVQQLIYHPNRNHVRHELLTFLQDDFLSKDPVLTSVAHDQIKVLEDVETPGTLRKTGPSLRHIAEKVSSEWLYDWIKDPTSFRPSTKMPRFFGQWRHLDGQEKELSKRYEPIEILGLVTYLLDESQPQTFLSAPAGMTESSVEEQVSRGRILFETRGCLACHQHDDFPYATANQGPELSNIGNKFDVPGTPDAQRWMYTWLKNPNLYHPRTKMPDLYLDVIEHPDGTKTDPASDIAMFLLNSKTGWAPEAGTAEALKLDDEGIENLNGLLFEHLKAKMAARDAEKTIEDNKIPEHVMENITGAELLLSGEIDTNKKLEYIGYRTISKYGCYACHDIPGFEDAKPIGAALADWGRKDPSKLAFEHIAEYLHHAHGHGGHGGGHGGDDHGDHSHEPEGIQTIDEPEEGEDLAEHQRQLAFDAEFYSEKVNDHDRAGFIWQKLKEPRSYDYAKARNKDSFNDRLRMPMFPFNYKEREAVITFVLGLVSEPPAPEFIYQPSEEREAIVSGTKVLEKFNCKGCHIMEPEQWSIEFAEGHFGPQGGNPNEAFPFMRPNFTTEEVEESLKVDKQRSLFHGHLVGMPTIDRDGVQVVYDEEGDPIEEDYEYDPQTLLYSFDLWEPTLLEGEAYQVGLNPLEIPASMITNHREALGGDLTKWLLPRVVELARESDPQADGKQAYGWLPPPLNGEGQKVQSDWLHEFLLEPYTIRPATFMRMPKFNMSPQDATDLVNYFASRDNAVYPYEYTEWTEKNRLNRDNAEYEAIVAKLPEAERPPGDTRLEQAMNIITSNDYCVKCHIVADYDPGGSLLAKAPDLSTVNRRLRPNYLRHWIAKPTQILPYTPMPINIQFNADLPHYGGVSQQLFHGTSIDQVDAVVDLLMNYSRYSNSRANVAELVKPADTPEQGAAETTEAAANDTVPATGSAGE